MRAPPLLGVHSSGPPKPLLPGMSALARAPTDATRESAIASRSQDLASTCRNALGTLGLAVGGAAAPHGALRAIDSSARPRLLGRPTAGAACGGNLSLTCLPPRVVWHSA
jgi:hypothetical protein